MKSHGQLRECVVAVRSGWGNRASSLRNHAGLGLRGLPDGLGRHHDGSANAVNEH